MNRIIEELIKKGETKEEAEQSLDNMMNLLECGEIPEAVLEMYDLPENLSRTLMTTNP